MKIPGFYVFCFLAGFWTTACCADAAAQSMHFQCGAKVESESFELWDSQVRDFVRQRLIEDRLLRSGDVYALYDFQTVAHNMVAMARRCGRGERLSEVAELIDMAYGALESGTPDSPGRRWICRGGDICNEKNRLMNTEVLLDSVQFLGLATSTANALVSSKRTLSPQDKTFARETSAIAAEHLLRWGSEEEIRHLQSVGKAKREQVKDGSSALFFSDKSLWQIAIYAELAGILNRQGKTLDGANGIVDRASADRMRRHLDALLQFFKARISYRKPDNRRITDRNAVMADIDRGYWRNYADLRYAGYEGAQKPVKCSTGDDGQTHSMDVFVPADSVPRRMDIGWDFSHARRLVPALDALERNRAAMRRIFFLSESQLPPATLPAAFANNLIATIWNGDADKPLFTNYWGGANGWYRVAYDNGTGKCVEGTPPFGLSDSFPTGGYATWAKYVPEVGPLGRRIYALMNSQDEEATAFIAKYYPALGNPPNTTTKALTRFMFLSSLVGNAAQ